MVELIHILTSQGFNERFEYHLRQGISQSKAYEITEEEHIKLIGRPHYSGFDSFRKVRERKTKRTLSR